MDYTYRRIIKRHSALEHTSSPQNTKYNVGIAKSK